MPAVRSFHRISGLLAIIAGPIAWSSLVLGLSAVGFNADLLADPQAVLAFSPNAAALIRWSFMLSMVGGYLLLMPLAFWLGATLGRRSDVTWRWYTFCGLSYLGLGALGAATLAAVWATLIATYPSTPPEQQPALLLAFSTATAIAEDGFQGVVQNLAGAVWWLALGAALRRQRRWLAVLSSGLGVLFLLTVVGNLAGSETLSLIGLSATVLLAPLWSIWIGVVVARQSLEPAQLI